MNIEWVGSPNYWTGRGKKIVAIVDHIAAGYMPGNVSWFKNPASKASAHYLVTREGKVLQLVREGDTAWHAGIANKPNWSLYDGTNPNRYTLGIEHEGYPDDGLTEAQYQATLQLHKELTAKYEIPRKDPYIIGHYRIDSVDRPNCPGPKFPWQRLFNDLNGKSDPSTEAWDWAIAKGITDGKDPLGTVTKQEVAAMIYRAMGIVPDAQKFTFEYKLVGETHVVELDPMLLKAKERLLMSGDSLKLPNFVTGNFFWWDGKTPVTIGWLISEGKVLHDRHEYKTWKGNPKGTFIVYKNGQVEVGWKWDSEIMKVVSDIWFCYQGFNLYPPKMTVKQGIAAEGFEYATVGYSTNRVSIGYNKDTGKAIIAVRPNSDAERAVLTMGNLGCENAAICSDSGISAVLGVDGKKYLSTDRVLSNILYW